MTGDETARAAPESYDILGMRVDRVDEPTATREVVALARRPASSTYVCVANVHMTMEAYDDPGFRSIVNSASLVVPDGMPLVWTMRGAGHGGATRVRGPDLVLRVAAAAAREAIPIGLYGGSPDVLAAFEARLRRDHPNLAIPFVDAPPFRAATPDEDDEMVRRFEASGARILFVGLGCPKQERWMAAHRGRVPGVMIGVGAAFDMHAGRIPEAPVWLRDAGLEWLYRLAREPRRLFLRYARHNPRFVALTAAQLVRQRLLGGTP